MDAERDDEGLPLTFPATFREVLDAVNRPANGERAELADYLGAVVERVPLVINPGLRQGRALRISPPRMGGPLEPNG